MGAIRDAATGDVGIGCGHPIIYPHHPDPSHPSVRPINTGDMMGTIRIDDGNTILADWRYTHRRQQIAIIQMTGLINR